MAYENSACWIGALRNRFVKLVDRWRYKLNFGIILK